MPVRTAMQARTKGGVLTRNVYSSSATFSVSAARMSGTDAEVFRGVPYSFHANSTASERWDPAAYSLICLGDVLAHSPRPRNCCAMNFPERPLQSTNTYTEAGGVLLRFPRLGGAILEGGGQGPLQHTREYLGMASIARGNIDRDGGHRLSSGARGKNSVSGVWFLDNHAVRVKHAGGVVAGSEVGRLPP